MAEENDKTGRDEALNEDASTPETADDATDETPVAEAPAKAGKFDRRRRAASASSRACIRTGSWTTPRT